MILCAGEALIDMLPRESTLGEDAYAPYPGGAVFNTATALGRLGAKTGFFCGFSNDFFGDSLKAQLAKAGVDTSGALTVDRPSTIAYVKLVDGQATYAFYDENTAARMITIADLPPLDATTQAVFCGGISLPVDPCGAAYETLFTTASATCVTMLDPNIRPDFIADEPTFRARIEHMLDHADIVKVSDEDLEWLVGDGDVEAQVADLLARGIKIVCLTEGSKGVRGFTARGSVTVAAQKAQVVDTVGAGDTFNAGLLAHLQAADLLTKEKVATISDADLSDALGLAVRAAAVTVSRAGANPPWKHEL